MRIIDSLPSTAVLLTSTSRELDRPYIQRTELVEPSLFVKGANFIRAGASHIAAGTPQATDEQVAERFAICQACPLFKPKEDGHGVCTHSSCGCSLKTIGLTGKNKLRWADQACPIGSWEAIKP